MILNYILLFVASAIIFSLLIPKPQIEDAKAQEFSEDGFPKATENAPIPYLLGKTRLESPNTLFAGNFRAVPITEKVKTGIFSSKQVITGYQYYVTLDLGFCLGDTANGVTLHEVVVDGEVVYTGEINTANTAFGINSPELFGGFKNGGGFVSQCRFYPGTFSQPTNAYIDALPDSGGLQTPYRGVCHVVFEDALIGESPQLRPIAIVASRYTNRLGLAGSQPIVSGGSNWAEALYDVLVNTYGGLGADPDLLDGPEFISVASVMVAEGQGVSGVIQNASEGEGIIKELLKQADALLTVDPSTNLVQPKLLRKDYDEGSLSILGPADISSVDQFNQTLWTELVSEVKAGFRDPDNNYQNTTAVAQDLAVANITGKLKTTSISLPFVKNKQLANDIAGRELNQLSQIVTQVKFKANRKAYQFKPGSVFKWTWPDYGIVEMILRVKEVTEGDDNSPTITVSAIRDTYDNTNNPFGLAPETGAQPLVTNPLPINASDFFDAPEFIVKQTAGLTDATTDDDTVSYIHMLPKPANDASISVDGFIDNDPMFTDARFPLTATFGAELGATDGFADGIASSLLINGVDDSRTDELTELGVLGITDGQQLFWANGEILGYENFVDNGGGSFTLTNVHRALLNTKQQDHPIGDTIYFIDGNTTSESLAINTPASVKLVPSNGITKLNPTALPAISVALTNAIFRPDPPDYTLVNGSRNTALLNDGATINLSWTPRDKSAGFVQLIEGPADVEPPGTTYNVVVYNWSTMTTLATSNGISGTSTSIALPSGQEGSTIEVQITAVRDGVTSIEFDFYRFNIAGANQLLLSGDAQAGGNVLLLSGDEQTSGVDNINLSGDEA